MRQSLPLPENDLFSILSHPLRRKILKEIYFNRMLSFSDMSHWKVKPGTLYFHLKELQMLITQNDDKQYMLTEIGKEVCKWFIGSSNEAIIIKYEMYTHLSRKILNAVYTNLLLQFILIFLVSFSFWIAYTDNLLVIGSYVMSSRLQASSTIFLNLIAIAAQFIIMAGVIFYFSSTQNTYFQLCYKSILTIVLSYSITSITIIIIWYISSILTVQPRVPFFWIFVTLSQIIAGITIMGGILILTKSSIQNALLGAVILLYLNTTILLFYLL